MGTLERNVILSAIRGEEMSAANESPLRNARVQMAAAQQSALRSTPILKTEGDVVTNIMIPLADEPPASET